jgi:drug/metabolite transporter (DMT)-like permease
VSKAILTPRLKSDLTLLLAAAIWGSGFVAQRLGANSMSALYFNGSRFLLAAFLLLGLVRFRWRLGRRSWKIAGLAGTFLFAASLAQQAGMATTTIGNTAFITGLYVVIIPLFMFLFWRERTTWATLAAVGLAAGGIALLALQDSLVFNPGDWLELVGAFLWAGHVILIGKLSGQVPEGGFALAIGQFLVCAAWNLLAGLLLEPGGAPSILLAWPAVIYSAIFPVAAGFTLQILGQRNAPPVDSAIILSMEMVFGALFGFLVLGEGFSPRQMLGAGLILAAILLCQVKTGNTHPATESE